MSYTPTTEEVREAVAEWMWSRRMFRDDLSLSDGQELDRWLATVREAELRARDTGEGFCAMSHESHGQCFCSPSHCQGGPECQGECANREVGGSS